MNYRLLYDYLNKLLEISKALRELSYSDNISYEKAAELRKKQDEAYKRWLFYKNLQEAISTKCR